MDEEHAHLHHPLWNMLVDALFLGRGFPARILAMGCIQWDATLPYIEQHRLEKDTHNKTIQKAVESFRITDEQKALLKTLRAK